MPRLFDAYIMVDWSASSVPTRSKDSIWVGVLDSHSDGEVSFDAVNPETRLLARKLIEDVVARRTLRGDRVLLGFDFSLGYPAGTAEALGLDTKTCAPWTAMYSYLAANFQDQPDNSNQRFIQAAAMNERMSGGPYPFWGTPPKFQSATLSTKKGGDTRPNTLPEYRATERYLREHHNGQPKSCWQLYGAGAVGSQSLLGIPHIHALRESLPNSRIWPFETGFEKLDEDALEDIKIVIAEIYPSILEARPEPGEVKDKAQVRAIARHYYDLDDKGDLGAAFAPPNSLDRREIRQAEVEEGWILGK